MSASALGRGYPEEADAQHYAELSFRVTGLQVSVYAIPGTGMRLSWRYTTPEGRDVVGNSAQEVVDLVQDETPVPQGSFRVKLQLKRKKDGVEVAAYLNGESEPFAHKFLEGLQGRSAKVALGCRNLVCTFDDLVVRGLQARKGRIVRWRKPRRSNAPVANGGPQAGGSGHPSTLVGGPPRPHLWRGRGPCGTVGRGGLGAGEPWTCGGHWPRFARRDWAR
ncbi:hypothetical protein ACN28S_26345 [Cystobacter fuscus]